MSPVFLRPLRVESDDGRALQYPKTIGRRFIGRKA